MMIFFQYSLQSAPPCLHLQFQIQAVLVIYSSMHELVAQPVKLGDFRSHFKKDIIVYIFDIHRDLFKSKIRNRQANIILLTINLTDPPKNQDLATLMNALVYADNFLISKIQQLFEEFLYSTIKLSANLFISEEWHTIKS